MGIKTKNDHCWKCGTRLDRPYRGQSPEAHECGLGGCVVCPRCGKSLCEHPAGGNGVPADKVKRIESLIHPAAPPAESGRPGGGPAGEGKAAPKAVDLPPVPAFPTDVLPEALARYVREGAEAMGCPEDYLALPMLVLAGAAIGGSRVLEVKPGWREAPCLYGAVVGDPGTTKSPALKAVMAPFEERQRELEREYEQKREKYEEAQNESREKGKRPRLPIPKGPLEGISIE
jgi:hypothetical protein